ncbi:MAG: choice-of-anchor D domain-containing protein [Terriglobia bacterium]
MPASGANTATTSGGAGVTGSGVSSPPALSVSPSTLDFGGVTVGSSSILPLLVQNQGTSQLTISQISAAGRGFTVSGLGLPLVLAAGQSASLSVTFAPNTGGGATGSVTVISNASNPTATVSVSATGDHSVTLSWSASPTSGISGYNVYRGTSPGGPYTKLNASLVQTTAYSDDAIDAGQTYYYVTTAVAPQSVESADSNQAEAVIPSP